MSRLLYTLGALAMMSGLLAGVSSPPFQQPAHRVEVVGKDRPLFLGSTVVNATALPQTRAD